MKNAFVISSTLLVLILLVYSTSRAEDYVILKNGQTIKCAVLREDTTAIITTDWNLRTMTRPPLQVYARSEVESLWFVKPSLGGVRSRYAPHPSGLEGGGGFSLQTWAETDLTRRYLAVLSLEGGLTITRSLGVEADADFTFPFGGHTDPIWKNYKNAYQVVMNAVVHPVVWNGFVPFVVAGGGAALGIPLDRVILSNSNDIRTLVDFGLGVKWGAGGVGYAIEWRHHYYIWTPDEEINGLRAPEQYADASVIRATIFVYR